MIHYLYILLTGVSNLDTVVSIRREDWGILYVADRNVNKKSSPEKSLATEL